uniref:Putative secreted protein n=1 Tax=Hyalomma excavatum TaxID=257692 RepID=A0A131XJD4_9ACAR
MLVATLLLFIGLFVSLDAVATPGIFDALTTKEMTYVLPSLYGNNDDTCSYYKTYNISCPYHDCFYHLRFYHRSGPNKTGSWNYGELQNPRREIGQTKNPCLLRMDISNFKTTQQVAELERRVLVSWNPEVGCAVYTILVNNTQKMGCELHVRSSALKNMNNSGYPNPCVTAYKQHCDNGADILERARSCMTKS